MIFGIVIGCGFGLRFLEMRVYHLCFLYLIFFFLFLYAYNLCLLVSTVVCVLFDTACV